MTRPTLRGRLSVVLLVIALAFVAVALARNWSDVRTALGQMAWTDVALSAVAGAGAVLLTAVSWRILLAGLGAPTPMRPALTVYCAAQLGKYVPGSVWVVAMQAELGRRLGVPRAVMAMSYVVAVLVAIASGGLVGLLSLLASEQSMRMVAPAVAGVGVLAVLLLVRPRAANAAIAWVARRMGRPLPGMDVPGRALAGALAVTSGAWVLFGAHVWLLARPLGAGADQFAPVTGAFALAFVAGLLLVPLPAGAGVREGVLVALLAGPVGAAGALAVGVVSRFILIAVDLLLAATFGAGRLVPGGDDGRRPVDPPVSS